MKPYPKDKQILINAINVFCDEKNTVALYLRDKLVDIEFNMECRVIKSEEEYNKLNNKRIIIYSNIFDFIKNNINQLEHLLKK